MANNNLISIRSFQFALQIIKLFRFVQETKKEYHLSKQLLRSATSIGANVREAEHAQSKRDFVHKMAIALKEANETRYWLELIYHSDYIDYEIFKDLLKENTDLIKILASIIKTTKAKYFK